MKRAYWPGLLLVGLIVLGFSLFIVDRKLRSNFENRQRHLDHLGQVIESYYFDHGEYPSDLQKLPGEAGISLAKPFSGNLSYERISGTSYVISEIDARRCSLFRSESLSLERKRGK